MRKVIARVKLNPGQGGYFDPISRIHLTHGDPEKDIYSDMNVSGIKAAVRNKRISLISGSLGDLSPAFKLIRRPDGKVALITNNQEKTLSSSAPETVTPKKEPNVMKVREEYKKPKAEAETVQKKDTANPEMAGRTVKEVVKDSAPELPAVETVVSPAEEQAPVAEDAVKKEKKKNPFSKKKDKKTENTKEDSVESKTEEKQ